MQNERLEQLFSMEALDNEDPLIKYMIALELAKKEDKTCETYFLDLIEKFPDFLATYYIAGEYFYNHGNYTISAEILNKGLLVAENQKNNKAFLEIKNLLVNVDMEL